MSVHRRRRDWLPATLAVVAIGVLAASQLSSSGGNPEPSVAPPSAAPGEDSTAAPATPLATPQPTSIAESDPSWTLDLIGQLECDGPPANIGGEVGQVFEEGVSPESPEAAMDVFVATSMYTSLPAKGYERTDLEPQWARYVHRADGKIKAVVILGDAGEYLDPGTWSVVGLRACDASEFAPGSGFTGATVTVWLDAEGNRMPTTRIHEIRGPGHCGWESTTWLRLDGPRYIRDPDSVLEVATVLPFDPDVALPDDARSTGYHEGERTIWRNDDPDAIYVVIADRVERWPRATDELGCM